MQGSSCLGINLSPIRRTHWCLVFITQWIDVLTHAHSWQLLHLLLLANNGHSNRTAVNSIEPSSGYTLQLCCGYTLRQACPKVAFSNSGHRLRTPKNDLNVNAEVPTFSRGRGLSSLWASTRNAQGGDGQRGAGGTDAPQLTF
jgi:hypothetical protein